MTHEAARGGAHHHLDTLPWAVAVIRDRRIVYANGALLALLGCAREQLVGLPLEPFPSRAGLHEMVWHTPAGARHVELTLTPSGGDTVALVRDLSDRVAQRQVLRRLADLGASLPGLASQEDVQRRVFEGLGALGLSHAWLVPEGRQVRIVQASIAPAHRTGGPLGEGQHLMGCLVPWNGLFERAWSEGACCVQDFGWWQGEHLRLLRPEYAVCARIEGEGAAEALLMVTSKWLREDALPSLRLFAAQVSAALAAARTISGLSARNAALASINHLAALAATAGQAEDLWEPGLAAIASFARCASVLLFLRAEGSAEMELVGHQGVSADLARRYQRTTPYVVLSHPVLHGEGSHRMLYAEDWAEPLGASLNAAGRACMAIIPLRVRSHTLGQLVLTFNVRRELSELEWETLTAMGVHFAAALESQRLLREVRGRAEELTRLHSEFKRTQSQLVERERLAALGELSAMVAHEVRNPLAAIFNALATLRRFQEPSGPSYSLVGILSEEAHRLNQLMDDLLDFARPPSPELRRVALSELLEDAVGRAAQGQPRLQVEWALAEDVPCVSVDERMMRQVFLNLALNAVQAMPQGGTLRIRVFQVPGVGATVEFTDTGPGIPVALRERLFEPFFTTKATGTGLGLAIVRRTLRAHGGDITIDSPPQGGTTMRLVLPLAETPRETRVG